MELGLGWAVWRKEGEEFEKGKRVSLEVWGIILYQ